MKQFVKYFLRFLVIIIIAFIAFFFWASSSTLNSTEYKVVSELENKVKPENDTIFSIVTYNIGYLSGMTNNRAIEKPKQLFDNNMNKVLLETKNVNPDIIAFQEIDYNASRSYNVNQETEIAALGYAASGYRDNYCHPNNFYGTYLKFNAYK